MDVDELIDVAGRATIEVVLTLPAREPAGPYHPGKCKSREVESPAYAAMRTQSRLGGRMLDILMRGVSERNYRDVLPEMAETVGISKYRVSRGFIEASE